MLKTESRVQDGIGFGKFWLNRVDPRNACEWLELLSRITRGPQSISNESGSGRPAQNNENSARDGTSVEDSRARRKLEREAGWVVGVDDDDDGGGGAARDEVTAGTWAGQTVEVEGRGERSGGEAAGRERSGEMTHGGPG
ncbi:hypothetical protein UA08_07898 [Talaromyces atroroseus]|uniref:Uncharacterized protein n=1 Tax=Talaromyces atroroseus TaxID=1441469 RepID=A0A225ATX9_TALAT|nr:hypothetical protein UA08_07898 [Talaromyces atroroseus]OKL56927.1 hypothetical protein UA08_07898 [Talaromyces atroroseus]